MPRTSKKTQPALTKKAARLIADVRARRVAERAAKNMYTAVYKRVFERLMAALLD